MTKMTTNGLHNGVPKALGDPHEEPPLRRAEEVKELLEGITNLIAPFIAAADQDATTRSTPFDPSSSNPSPVLLDQKNPAELAPLLNLTTPLTGTGKDGLLSTTSLFLSHSVNTWSQGFMDKLYASTNPIGLASDLLLSTLNTNAHVYAVSPALTLVEKHVTTDLARRFGFTSPFAGGISQPGGSASNGTAMVIARNTLFPGTKEDGCAGRRLVLFTSVHGHYSVEKAAGMYGIGRKGVRSVPVDHQGRMKPAALERMIVAAKQNGEEPFFVNATAGTTVLGSYDPLAEIADVCGRQGVWMHVDGSWGGSMVWNEELARTRLRGVERADSVAVTPHKMLQVPMTCSFLLGRDLRTFWRAMTLPAGYLYHTQQDDAESFNPATDLYDLGDLTPQCGRRADSLKLYLSLQYYGLNYWSDFLAKAFDTAKRFHALLATHPDFILVPLAGGDLKADEKVHSVDQTNGHHTIGISNAALEPPPCLQVCFYFAPGRKLASDPEVNTARSVTLAQRLIGRGWMVDYAPGEQGNFLRVVVNGGTRWGTMEGFVKAMESVGREAGWYSGGK